MQAFDWAALLLVLAPLLYVSTISVAGWGAALRRGEAVTLVPPRAGRPVSLPAQGAVIVLAIVLFVALLHVGWIPLFALPPPWPRVLAAIGLVLYLGGVAVVLWARRTLGKNWGVSSYREVALRPDHELVTRGPFAVERHPMYVGWWTACFGLVLVYPVWGVAVLFLATLASFWMRARREEEALAGRFGPLWWAYRDRTRSMVPFMPRRPRGGGE